MERQREREVERERHAERHGDRQSKTLSKRHVGCERRNSSAAPPSCPAGAPPGPSSQVPTALAPTGQKGSSLMGWAWTSEAG